MTVKNIFINSKNSFHDKRPTRYLFVTKVFIIVLSAILCLMYFVLFSLVYSSHGVMAIWRFGVNTSNTRKTPVLKNQPMSVLLWRELQ